MAASGEGGLLRPTEGASYVDKLEARLFSRYGYHHAFDAELAEGPLEVGVVNVLQRFLADQGELA
eukprot:3628945-Alexandrium_andersonii.AAC.1